MVDNVLPERQDLVNLLTASLLVAVAFTSFSGTFSLDNLIFYTLVGLIITVLREGGQRTVAHWMDSNVDLKISRQGAFLTLMAAVFSSVANLQFILLFPVYSEFSGERYVQWGKEIDAMWMKRKYWLTSAGIIGLWAGWFLAYLMDLTQVAQAVSVFTIFQLLPFDYDQIPTGPLDGATLLRWSGFAWLMMSGLSIIMLVLTI